jgi:small subunit ribosomal protein S1
VFYKSTRLGRTAGAAKFAAIIQVYSMSESFAELFEESLKTVDMEPGSIVTGVVIDIDNEWVTVHAGLKSEGVIPRDQFLNASGECTLTIGDEVRWPWKPLRWIW